MLSPNIGCTLEFIRVLLWKEDQVNVVP